MENQTTNKYKAKFYCNNNGRIVVQEKGLFTRNISDVVIPQDCMFIEIYTFDGEDKTLSDVNALSVDSYLIGQRFDRVRHTLKDDREKINFAFHKVYNPHTVIEEKRIKYGRYLPPEESNDEFGS